MSERSPELADVIRQAIEDRLADLHVMLQGRIDSYDASLQKADVEPLIRRLQKTTDGEIAEDLPVIPGVPVVFPRAGGFKITMPVNAGDRCMLVFCERSTEVYQTGQGRRTDSSALINQSDPDTFEMHSLTDPVAVMGWYNDAEALDAPDATDMVLGEDGGPVIHIGNDQVNLYENDAADFVALAQKVKDELDLVKIDLDAVKTAYDSHTHLLPTSIPTVPPRHIANAAAGAINHGPAHAGLGRRRKGESHMSDFALDTFGELDLSTGNIVFFAGADAVAQHLKIRLRMVRGEWFLDTRIGLPYRSQIWVKNPNLAAIQSVLRRAISTTPGVEALERIDLSFDSPTRTLSVAFSAKLEGDDVARDFTEEFIL